MGRKLIDLTGQRFGRLTVTCRSKNYGFQSTWLCRCDCGKDKVVRGWYLKSGETKSCGCFRKELLSELMKKRMSDKRIMI